MKRLKLADFKSKNVEQKDASQMDQLLGQVLGACHDNSSHQDVLPELTVAQKS